MSPVRVLVATCAHRGDDARIVHRQARSLLEAGHQVTLVAPLPPSVAADPPGLVRVDVPRACGRRRLGAWRATRAAVNCRLSDHDLLLIHDPELVPVLVRKPLTIPVVWDVHEDFVASVADRAWIPKRVRSLVAAVVGRIERTARRRMHIMLAEDSYLHRFPGAPIVPNSTWVSDDPVPADSGALPRIVHVGRLSVGRGVNELLACGRALGGRADLVLIGDADREVAERLREAHDDGSVRWLGHLPNPDALAEVDGAFAGLALLRDEPNYRYSRPTKIIEYLAHGVPVVTTALPLAADLVHTSGGGVVVDHGDVESCVDAIERWLAAPADRDDAASRGHSYVERHHNWHLDGARFVSLIERWAAGARAGTGAGARADVSGAVGAGSTR